MEGLCSLYNETYFIDTLLEMEKQNEKNNDSIFMFGNGSCRIFSEGNISSTDLIPINLFIIATLTI